MKRVWICLCVIIFLGLCGVDRVEASYSTSLSEEKDAPTREVILRDTYSYIDMNIFYESGTYLLPVNSAADYKDERGFEQLYDEEAGAYVSPSEVLWKVSDETIASITENGELHCLSPGDVDVYVYLTYDITQDGIKHRFYVYDYIQIQVEENTFTSNELYMQAGDSYFVEGCEYEFTGSINTQFDSETSETIMPCDIVWKSEDESVIAFDEEGKLYAKGIGETQITLCYSYIFSNYTAKYESSATFYVEAKDSNTFDEYNLMDQVVLLNGTQELSGIFSSKKDDASDYSGECFRRVNTVLEAAPENFLWSSSNPSVVTVDEKGVVTGRSAGSAVISVSYTYTFPTHIDTYTQTCEIYVSDPQLSQSEIYFNIYGRSRYNGYYYGWDQLQLTGLSSISTVSFSTSGGELEVVEEYGGWYSLKAAKKGDYVVTFIADGKPLACTVHVVNIYFTRNSKSVGDCVENKVGKKWNEEDTMLLLYKGESASLKLNGLPAQSTVTWTSSNPKVATVSKDGKVKAKKNGYTTITATCGGFQLSYKVGVTYKLATKAIREAMKHYNSTYSQPKRMSKGYYDCSSYVWRSYKGAGYGVGNDSYAPTAAGMAQWCTQKGYVVGKGKVKVSKMLPGDLIFLCGESNGRYMGIYHVDLYVGNRRSITVARSKWLGDTLYNVIVARPYKTK